MFILGVTEIKGSGKDAFIKDFKTYAFLNHLNPKINPTLIPVINTDDILKDILTKENNEDIQLLLVSEYGSNILDDKTISLKNLMKAVLEVNPILIGRSCTKTIEDRIINFLSIVKESIQNEIEKKLNFYKSIDEPFVILGDSFLFNLGNNVYCNRIINLRNTSFEVLKYVSNKNITENNPSIVLALYNLNAGAGSQPKTIPTFVYSNENSNEYAFNPSINAICNGL